MAKHIHVFLLIYVYIVDNVTSFIYMLYKINLYVAIKVILFYPKTLWIFGYK